MGILPMSRRAILALFARARRPCYETPHGVTTNKTFRLGAMLTLA